jgi:hypothetical protein
MKNESLHNMLDAVLAGSENNAQMHFHNYLKDKFPKIVGKGIESGNEENLKHVKQQDSNEELIK